MGMLGRFAGCSARRVMTKPIAMQAFDILEIGPFMDLNGVEAPEELQELDVPLHSFMNIPLTCPFCTSALLAYGNFNLLDPYVICSPDGKAYHLWYCQYCRFWQWYYYFDQLKELTGDGCPSAPEQKACISKLREFSSGLPEVCSSELAQYLRRHPSEWHKYDPKRFEKLVADVFRENYDGAEVIHIGKPDDGGVDIVFVDSANQQWLVQVKRRMLENSSEGVSTIRNLIGAMILENTLRGVVVSTADHFTLRAQQAVQKAQYQGLYIELIDKGILNRMLDPILPDRPWLKVVKTHDLEVANLLAQKVPSDHQLRLFDL